MIIAAIDIGSNAARLLINQVEKHQSGEIIYTKINFLRIPLRLGLDVFKYGKILLEREKMLLQTMQAFKVLLEIYQVTAYRAYATSAMRDADNSLLLIQNIKESTGISIEVISGAQEADVLFQTHIAEQLNNKESYLYVDVGGGSTELTLFQQNKIVFKQSFNIGTIRMLNQQIGSEQWNDFKNFVKKQSKTVATKLYAIGSGGNINKIFSLSKTKEGKPLNINQLQEYYVQLKPLSIEERMRLHKLKEDRADVIVPALEIYTCVMKWANIQEIYVPKIGLADGLIRMQYLQLTKTNA